MSKKPNNRPVTIHDVAADARVSTATVSRTLNEPWRVKPSTRDRVLSSVSRLGYKPNLRARLLARGGANTVCFLLCNRPFIHSVHAHMLQGAAVEADERGVQIVYSACNYAPDVPAAEIALPRILGARGLIDGVIVAGTNYPNLLQALAELGLPSVVFGTNVVTGDNSRFPNAVYVDDESGGRQAARHLISLGHRKIVFIGDLSLPWYSRRYRGYEAAMVEAGLSPYPPAGCAARGEFEMGLSAADGLCEAGVGFTALVVGGDMGALGAIKALRNRGVPVPERVSVVGFNDEELAAIAEPPLTTVRLPMDKVGAACVRMLEKLISGEVDGCEPEVLDVELVRRQSAAQAPDLI